MRWWHTGTANRNAALLLIIASLLAVSAIALGVAVTLARGPGRHAIAAGTITPPTSVPSSTPTGTLPPTATPKFTGTGTLTGVYDVWVPGGTFGTPLKASSLFSCILLLSHNSTTNAVKATTQCVADTAIGDPNSQVPFAPGEGPDGLPGPPPPPPYNSGSPAVGLGTYDPNTDVLDMTFCFPNVGGGLAPNIISTTHYDGFITQLTSTGKAQGLLTLFFNQSNSQCRALSPSGTVFGAVLDIKTQPIDPASPVCDPGDCVPVPWRTPGDTDYDNDGCSDQQELTNIAHPATCGDDPWNSYDSSATDLSGSWQLLLTARRADACFGGVSDTSSTIYNCAAQPNGTVVPGAYFHCFSYMQQTGAKLSDDIQCYTDFGPNTNTFPIAGVAPGPGTPLAVNPEQCATCSGNGRPGAAPPGATGSSAANPILFADIDSAHAHLRGLVDSGSSQIRLWGCLPDLDTHDPLGWVYINATLQRYTWLGKVAMWTFQTQANCYNGTPSGAPSFYPAEAVKQSANPNYDTDQDGCPDRVELSDDRSIGGLRDPANRWDYFNPANNSVNRADDILAVVEHYGHLASPPGDPLYDTKYDRGGGIPGSNSWNLRPPSGAINTGDIIAAVLSYGHDCGTDISKATPTAAPTRTVIVKSPPPPTATPTP